METNDRLDAVRALRDALQPVADYRNGLLKESGLLRDAIRAILDSEHSHAIEYERKSLAQMYAHMQTLGHILLQLHWCMESIAELRTPTTAVPPPRN